MKKHQQLIKAVDQVTCLLPMLRFDCRFGSVNRRSTPELHNILMSLVMLTVTNQGTMGKASPVNRDMAI